MIVDSHTYTYERICGVTPYGIARPLGYGLADFGTNRLNRILPPSFVGSTCPVETLLAYLDWLGIDRAVLLTQNVYGYANEYLAECVKRFQNRFIAVGSLDPLTANSIEVLEHLLLSLHLRGLNLDLSAHDGLLAMHPDFRLDDSRVVGLWKLLERHDRTLMLSFGGSYGTPGHQVAELRVVLESCPDLKVVISHLGFPPVLSDEGWGTDQDWHDLLDLSIDFNVAFDTAIFWFSSALKNGPEEYPYPTLQEVFRRVLDRLGPSKLLWGSGLPAVLCWSTYAQTLRWIENELTALTQNERNMILWRNAAMTYGFDMSL